jgi:hypothetical protein
MHIPMQTLTNSHQQYSCQISSRCHLIRIYSLMVAPTLIRLHPVDSSSTTRCLLYSRRYTPQPKSPSSSQEYPIYSCLLHNPPKIFSFIILLVLIARKSCHINKYISPLTIYISNLNIKYTIQVI